MAQSNRRLAATHAAPLEEIDEKDRHLKILSAGLPRTGSYSMALALRQLGYRNVYHILDGAAQHPAQWHFFARAGDAIFPCSPKYNGRGMSRADWDEGMFGTCEGITDIAGIFAESLIEAYPEAKVILAERDFEPWLKSIKTLLGLVWSRKACLMRYIVEPIAGAGSTASVQRLMQSWMEADDSNDQEIEAKARDKWESHNRRIKEMVVPKERLLIFRIEEGWGPLCEFLGKPVPDTPFPHGNDAASLTTSIGEMRMKIARLALARMAWWALLAVVLFFGVRFVGLGV